jgi:two-component sensor histidine kinase
MEVDHRAKNVLAVVDRIVRLSNADDPAVYAASVQERVQSLSNAHQLLAKGGWQSVSLRQLIEAQLLRYSHPDITLTGGIVMVGAVTLSNHCR